VDANREQALLDRDSHLIILLRLAPLIGPRGQSRHAPSSHLHPL
jgi:hypothetical protein